MRPERGLGLLLFGVAALSWAGSTVAVLVFATSYTAVVQLGTAWRAWALLAVLVPLATASTLTLWLKFGVILEITILAPNLRRSRLELTVEMQSPRGHATRKTLEFRLDTQEFLADEPGTDEESQESHRPSLDGDLPLQVLLTEIEVPKGSKVRLRLGITPTGPSAETSLRATTNTRLQVLWEDGGFRFASESESNA